VHAAVDLLDGGATVPFIARYRKEVTGSLDDEQLRTLEERLRYLREAGGAAGRDPGVDPQPGQARRGARGADPGGRLEGPLEDIYLPYKPKRRTRRRSPARRGWNRWPRPCSPTPRWTRPRRPPATSTRSRRADAAPRWTAPGHPRRALLRGRRPHRRAAARRCGRAAGIRPVREGKREPAPSSRLLRLRRAVHQLPSHRILALFRGEKEEILDLTMSRTPTRSPGRRADRVRARIAVRSASPTRAGRPTVAGRHRPLGVAHPYPWCISASTCGCGCGRRRGGGGAGVRRPTCATCCSPRRPAPADDGPRPGLPHRREGGRASTPPARSSPRTRSTRT
jgi:uncharacterized protein